MSDKTSPPISALNRGIELCGNRARLAARVEPHVAAKGLKCSGQHVFNWLTRDGGVPSAYVLAVAAATDWQVTPHELRPDLYPNPTDALPVDGAGRANPTERAAA